MSGMISSKLVCRLYDRSDKCPLSVTDLTSKLDSLMHMWSQSVCKGWKNETNRL